MMEAVSTSETSVNYQTWRNTPEESDLHTRRRENKYPKYRRPSLSAVDWFQESRSLSATALTELHRKVSVQKLKSATQYYTTVDLDRSALAKREAHYKEWYLYSVLFGSLLHIPQYSTWTLLYGTVHILALRSLRSSRLVVYFTTLFH
jgi:hypothetical protein